MHINLDFSQINPINMKKNTHTEYRELGTSMNSSGKDIPGLFTSLTDLESLNNTL
jgi:hypothetical protein